MTTKIVLLGPSNVGKSAILRYLNNQSFITICDSTVGCHFTRIRKDDIILDIWDTAGQERYMSIGPIYYRNADIIIAVFDVSNMMTIDKMCDFIQMYYNTVCDMNKLAKIIIVGNKVDQENLSKQTLMNHLKTNKYIQQYNLQDIEPIFTSAKTGINMNTLSDKLLTYAIESQQNNIKETITNTLPIYDIKPRSCCNIQ